MFYVIEFFRATQRMRIRLAEMVFPPQWTTKTMSSEKVWTHEKTLHSEQLIIISFNLLHVSMGSINFCLKSNVPPSSDHNWHIYH